MFKECFSELLAATHLYLIQEFSPSERVVSDEETFTYFKNLALQQKRSASPAPSEQIKTMVKAVSAPPKEPIITDIIAKPAVDKAIVKIEKEAIKADKQEVKEKPFFVPELPKQAAVQDFVEMRKAIKERLPHFVIIDQIPDDRAAYRTKNRDTASQVIILSLGESAAWQLFFANLKRTLAVYQIQAQIVTGSQIENDPALLNNEQLKLIIATSTSFLAHPALSKQLHGAKHLLLIPDLMKEPQLKASIWKAIQSHFTKIFTTEITERTERK